MILYDNGPLQIEREEWPERTVDGYHRPARTDYRVLFNRFGLAAMTLAELSQLRAAIGDVLAAENGGEK